PARTRRSPRCAIWRQGSEARMNLRSSIAQAHDPSARALLSTLPAGPRERARAVAMLVVSFIVFLACAPYAKVMLQPVPAFLPAYQAALILAEVVTVALLLGQFAIRRSAGLLVLGCAYAFSA